MSSTATLPATPTTVFGTETPAATVTPAASKPARSAPAPTSRRKGSHSPSGPRPAPEADRLAAEAERTALMEQFGVSRVTSVKISVRGTVRGLSPDESNMLTREVLAQDTLNYVRALEWIVRQVRTALTRSSGNSSPAKAQSTQSTTPRAYADVEAARANFALVNKGRFSPATKIDVRGDLRPLTEDEFALLTTVLPACASQNTLCEVMWLIGRVKHSFATYRGRPRQAPNRRA
jgi:hypothetical protein